MIFNQEQYKDYKIDYKEEFSFDQCEGLIHFKVAYWGSMGGNKWTIINGLKERIQSTIFLDEFHLTFITYKKDLKYAIAVQVIFYNHLFADETLFKGVDGIIFVANSDLSRMEKNQEYYKRIKKFTEANEIPFLIQLNEPNLDSSEELKALVSKFATYPEPNIIYPPIMVVKCFQNLILQIILDYFKQ